MTTVDYTDFAVSQLSEWPEAAARYDALSALRRRRVEVGGVAWELLHNEARAVSTCARVDASSVAARPCFLCAANRPAVQKALPLLGGRYELLVNPFPVFTLHFTIAAASHTPQLLDASLADMIAASRLLQGLIVFYNGPRAGASAPDHLHFQAVPASSLPLVADGARLPFRSIRLHSASPDALAAAARDAIAALPVADDCPEPSLNAFCLYADGSYRLTIIPRRAHRPQCYGRPGGYLVSPGAIDVGGVIIMPRHSDFAAITAADVKTILTDVTYESPV